jgi:hypothetical protein
MRINYSGNKKRKEEARRKKQEEKRQRRLNKDKHDSPVQEPEIAGPETVPVPPQL